MLDSIVSHFDTIEERMDQIGKKGLLRIVFKTIAVEEAKVKKYELFEPFQSLHDGVKIKCQLMKNQQVTEKLPNVSTYAPSAAK